jgi:hypothetical protein
MKIEKQLLLNGKPTKNHRYYPEKVLRSIVEQIESGNIFGTLDHPERDIVDLRKALFTVENLQMEKDELYGDISFLPLTNEQRQREISLVKEMLENGSAVIRPNGISATGFQSREMSLLGVNAIVGDDYRLISFSVVPKDQDALNIEGEVGLNYYS